MALGDKSLVVIIWYGKFEITNTDRVEYRRFSVHSTIIKVPISTNDTHSMTRAQRQFESRLWDLADALRGVLNNFGLPI